MNNRHYAELDKLIAKSRRERQMRQYKENTLTTIKFIGCALLVYGSAYLAWCTLYAMFPTWP